MNLTSSNSSRSSWGGVRPDFRAVRAFTLIELLAVIAIIGILASLTAPIFVRFGAGDKLSAGGRQLLDDLSLARAKAMATRSTVYLVFVDPLINETAINWANYDFVTNHLDRVAITNLSGMTYSGYALYSERSVGDQPGTFTPRYLTKWKELPPGVAIHPDQFFIAAPAKTNYVSGYYPQPFPKRAFPFPNADSPDTYVMPYLAFNAMGQLVGGQNFRVQISDARLPRYRDPANQDRIYMTNVNSVVVPDAPPAIFLEWENKGVAENVNYTNITFYAHEIEINWLTGRGKFLQPQIQ